MTNLAIAHSRPDADADPLTLSAILDLAVECGLVTREQVEATTGVVDHGEVYDVDRTSVLPVSCRCEDGRHRGYRGDGALHTAYVHTYSLTSAVR